MASGFLELAYLGEMSIVFNLAYAELKSERYFQKAQKIISDLREKLEYDEYIHRDRSELFTHLKNIDSDDSSKRQSAWSGNKKGFWCFIRNWFFADVCYGFFHARQDKKTAMWALFITSLILILSTAIDHFHLIQQDGWAWILCFGLLLTCLAYPPVIILVGRGMRSQLDYAVERINSKYVNEHRPGIVDLIAKASNTIA